MPERRILYILKRGKPRVEKDPAKWMRWMDQNDRVLAAEGVGRQAVIRTMFTGQDESERHVYDYAAKKPLLFETTVFGGELDACQARYADKKSALEGHAKMVERVKRLEGINDV
jgi:hypothetical protein